LLLGSGAVLSLSVTQLNSGKKIRGFRHKGIEKFSGADRKLGFGPALSRLNDELTFLNMAINLESISNFIRPAVDSQGIGP
jgi:hypothetical protein